MLVTTPLKTSGRMPPEAPKAAGASGGYKGQHSAASAGITLNSPGFALRNVLTQPNAATAVPTPLGVLPWVSPGPAFLLPLSSVPLAPAPLSLCHVPYLIYHVSRLALEGYSTSRFHIIKFKKIRNWALLIGLNLGNWDFSGSRKYKPYLHKERTTNIWEHKTPRAGFLIELGFLLTHDMKMASDIKLTSKWHLFSLLELLEAFHNHPAANLSFSMTS